MDGLPSDRRILHIAAEAAEANDKNVPLIFLGLKDVLTDYIIGTPKANKIRAEMWDYDLTQSINLALKQDFSVIDGAWHTAAELSTVTCSACLGFVPANKVEFKKHFLPDVVGSLLVVAGKIQSLVLKTDDAVLKKQHLMDLRVVLQSLTTLYENYKFLALQVISAKKFMQLLMTEEEQTCLIMMIFTQNILRADMNCLAEVNQSRLHAIVDEIVFKIFSTQHVSIASSSMRVLLLCLDLHPPLLKLLSSRRYRLGSNLKKWAGRGFDEDLKRFNAMLEASSAQQIEIVKKNEAAALIQSVYRGHMTRKRLEKANNAIGKFHKIYREKKKRKEEQKIRDMELKERDELEKSKRRNEFLSSRAKQLKIIESIPAKTVNKFLQNVESEAACKIQTIWRGFKVRRKLAPELVNHKRVLAAVKIQRQVRKWLARCRARKAFLHTELVPSGLTTQRRAELHEVIAKMRDKFPPKATTFEELKDLNDKMFHMLNNHVMELRSKRRREQRINALMAQLSVDSDTLLNSPNLNDVTREHVELFSSRSRPVAAAARRQHNETLKKLKDPWWKSLMEENDEKDLAALKERLRESGLDDDTEKQF